MKILKIAGIVLLSVTLLIAGLYMVAVINVGQRMKARYAIENETLAIPTDSASILKGQHLVDIKGCKDCHADNLAGKVFNDDGAIGRLVGSNLTKGKGGIPSDYTAEDWARAIRHGVYRSGLPIIVMPSVEYSKMTREDLQAMIAYLSQLAPIDNTLPTNNLGPVINVMTLFDAMPLLAAEKIDHDAEMVAAVDPSSPLEYGKYLAVMCSACHQESMKGGEPMAPGFPPPPDLSSTGVAGRWTIEEFKSTLRSGKRPDGTMLDPSMPWQMTQHYTDAELEALYAYLKTQ